MTTLQRYQQLLASGEITPDSAQQLAAERLDALAQTLHRTPARPVKSRRFFGLFGSGAEASETGLKGLYLYGPVGRGKSMLMDMFHDEVTITPRRRLHFHEFMQGAHSLIHKKRQRGAGGVSPIVQAADEIADSAKLLCFDEMEVRDIADAMVLARLFTRLFERGVVVVTTSNRHPDELYRRGLHRDRFLPFIALLKDKVEVLDLGDGKDYRRDRLVGEDLYLTPLGRAARDKVDAAFEALTDGSPAEPDVVVVNAREVAVPRAAKSVARFRFDEICGIALGPSDYLAIAQRYRAIVIDGIPRMTDDIRDKARRFITLVDALYERRCQFVCSAEVPVEELYAGVDWGFEFDRTVSRLLEMRSISYLQEPHRA